jgi:hypothetical protein
MHEDARVALRRRSARGGGPAAGVAGARRAGRQPPPGGWSDQRQRMTALPRRRGWNQAVRTLDLVNATGTSRILPSAPDRAVGPTVPPWWSERPAAPRHPAVAGGFEGTGCPAPRAGSRPVSRRSWTGPRRDRAPAVSGEGSIDRARCGQPPMRNIFVPQTGQVPWVAGLPFFIVIFCASFISRFALHFTQYASATPGASLSSRWTSSGPSPGARPLRAIRVRRSHLVRIRRTQQIRGGANSRNGSPRRIGASSRFPRDWAG